MASCHIYVHIYIRHRASGTLGVGSSNFRLSIPFWNSFRRFTPSEYSDGVPPERGRLPTGNLSLSGTGNPKSRKCNKHTVKTPIRGEMSKNTSRGTPPLAQPVVRFGPRRGTRNPPKAGPKYTENTRKKRCRKSGPRDPKMEVPGVRKSTKNLRK